MEQNQKNNDNDGMSVQDDKIALSKFLLDIECLASLSKYIDGVNVFDVLKIYKTEIRHSNMLAWLFDPNENHGLKDSFIRGVFQKIVNKEMTLPKDVFRVLMANFYTFKIYREYKNIGGVAEW